MKYIIPYKELNKNYNENSYIITDIFTFLQTFNIFDYMTRKIILTCKVNFCKNENNQIFLCYII